MHLVHTRRYTKRRRSMLYDHKITKPASLNAYEIHKMVESLFKDAEGRNLFLDNGDHVLVRSRDKDISGTAGSPVREVRVGEIAFIELRASCFVSSGGKKHFLKPGDWRSRHTWLEKKGASNGFEVLTVTCSLSWLKIPKPNAEFSLDCTDFSACIKVTELQKFSQCLEHGIGAKGRAFGFGMVIL